MVEVGNAYINRATTGAIVGRQPFGGWKRSSVGPGAKAGGPNYVSSLGTWTPTDLDLGDAAWLARAEASDEEWWDREFAVEHDPSGLFCESNVFRYRPIRAVAVRVQGDDGAGGRELTRVLVAAERCGVPVVISRSSDESAVDFAGRIASLGVDRIRTIGPVAGELWAAANAAGVHIADEPVTTDGRIELLHYLREQSVSRTLHRYGNLV
jgi:RHH-type proline utilization regulon transcriptional repressor/proline dehydrogenase/delta 1-pyrroline-5-carboxylate dehydrogenase